MFLAVFRLFQRYRAPVLLTLSGFIVPLVTNLASSWIEHTVGGTPARLIQIIAILVAVTVVVFGMTVITRLAPRRWSIIPDDLKATRKKGLILTVGPGRLESPQQFKDNPAYIAVDYHRAGGLRAVWAITSQAGTPTYNHLVSEFPEVAFTPLPVYNIHSVAETYQAAQKIYHELMPQAGLSPEEVIADFTGGLKPMSVGLALACANLLPMQFITGSPGHAPAPLQTDFHPASAAADRQPEG